MNISLRLTRQLGWLNVPSSVLIALLQRTPAVRVIAVTGEMILSSPIGSVLKASCLGVASLGAVQTMAGATQLSTSSPSPLNVSVGGTVPGGGVAFEITGTPAEGANRWEVSGTPPGLSFGGVTNGQVNGEVIVLSGTPTTAGNYNIMLTAINDAYGTLGPYTYTVSVTGGGGGNTAPSITLQPVSQAVNVGGSVNFTAAADGTPAPTIRWQKNSSDIPGATSTTLTLTNVQLSDNGASYTMIATNLVSSATTTPAVLTVNSGNTAPSITLQPVSQSVNVGGSVTFTAGATGTPAPTVRWQKDNVDIPGAVSTTLTLNNVQPGDAATYTMIATNVVSSAATIGAVLTVNTPTAPSITLHPVSQSVIVGASVTFTAGASGNPTPTVQWQKNSSDIPGATSTTLTLNNVQLGDNGASYTMVATNSVSSATTNPAVLTVTTPTAPAITLQPVGQSVLVGATVIFTAGASGNPTPTVQWQKNSSDIPGATSTTLTLTNVQLGDNGASYTMVATNQVSSATTTPAVLSVSPPPAVIKLSAGRYHSLRIDNSSRLYATGTNTFGQLGTGNTTTTNSPQLITLSGQTVTNVAAGAQHSLILTSAKNLWATGFNGNGQLGDGTVVSKSTPIQIATNVAGMAGGLLHSAYLKTDGTLWTVGGNDEGQLGNGTQVDVSSPVQIATNVVDLATGIRETLFVTADGTLWGTGDLYGSATLTSTPIQIATGVKTVAAGGYHSLFLKTDGTLWSLGYNAQGQLGTGDTTSATVPVQIASNVKAIATGFFHSLFIKTDNTLWACGFNSFGQLGDGTATNRLTPFQVTTNVTAVSGSESYTLFTKTDGSLWGTGLNGNGQFGNNGTTTVSSPVQITSGLLAAPSVPGGLAITPNAAVNGLNLSWQPVGSAAGYEVWRSTTNSFGSATRIAQNVRWAFYQDLTASTGTLYYYWITAVNPANTSAPSIPGAGSYGLTGAAVNDFNGDRKSDIIWQNTTSGDLGFWLMNGVNFASWVDMGLVSPDWRIAATADFDGDGKTDILWENTVTGDRGFWLMNGVNFASWVDIGIVTTDWHIAAAGDLNGDHKPDILWENTITGDRGFWLMNGTTFSSWQDIGVISTALKIVATADFNADGNTDIVWENTSTGKRVIWFMNGTTFGSSFNLGIVSTDWHIAAIADYDGDGQPDILWENTTTGDRGFWIMNGTTFTSWVDIGIVTTDWRIAP